LPFGFGNIKTELNIDLGGSREASLRKISTTKLAPNLAIGAGRSQSLFWTPLLVIGVTALAVEIPFLFLGTPSGHDVEFHLYSWLEVLSHWRQGVLFPGWASLAHLAYGEPRFIFYPPASWTLGALLSAILPWTIVSCVYIWIALVAAGVSMFFLARRWLDPRDAIFAAALYAANPYHLVIVYWRSAFAELLASCLLPLLLLFVLKAVEEGRRALAPAVIVPLGIVLAAAWLTNAPAAVMIHYSFALLIVFFVWRRKAPELLLVGGAAVVLGAGLAAFYLLPAIYEQKWINIAEAVSGGSQPLDNFLFVHTSDPDHDAFNRLISWIAALEIVATFGAAWAARAWIGESARESRRDLWMIAVGWAAVCSLMMLSLSNLLWTYLPKMRFMQFPWRWLLCLSLVFTIFVVSGLRRWPVRIALCAVSILLLVLAWHRIQAPWWDTADDLREMQDNVETGAGYEGTDEYTPAGADPSAIDKDARRVTVAGPAHAAIRVLQWNAESKTFTAQMSGPDQLALRLFLYPAWRVEDNGSAVQTSARAGTAQMLIPVQAGMNRIQITFTRTWDRVAGAWVSVIAWAGLLFWFVRFRRQRTRSA
jgi:6-pyruvoyl-tetrahydropterin synthase related domain